MGLRDIYHNWRRKRIIRKYAVAKRSYYDDKEIREAFATAYIETGDVRCLIDYLEVRPPKSNLYFVKAFRQFIISSVFRQYDQQRMVLLDYWLQTMRLYRDSVDGEKLIKKYFG